jgi:hypothetical protein
MSRQGYIGETAKRCHLGLLMKDKRGIEARSGREEATPSTALAREAADWTKLGVAWSQFI